MLNYRKDFQQHSSQNAKYDPTHTYIDVDVINNNLNDSAPKPLVFNQIKSQNIIDDCSEYHCSIIRWNCDSCLPVFIPEIQTKTSLVDLYVGETIYYLDFGVGIDIDNITPLTHGEPVIWKPQNKNSNLYPNWSQPVFKPASQIEVLNNPYFYASSIQWVLTLLNNTLNALYIKLTADYSAYFPNVQRPYFRWNPALNKIDLAVSAEFTDITPNPQKLRLFITMNAPLYNLLNTFSYEVGAEIFSLIHENFTNYKRAYPFILTTLYNPDLPTVVNDKGKTLYIFTQEASSVPTWSPVSSIVFISYTIPVNSSESGAPQFLGDNPLQANSVNNLSNAISDFQISQDVGTELANSVLYYTPSAEYRLFDLNSNQPLSNLNIKVYWKSKWGQYHDFYLKYAGSASMKLLFRKKNFESANYIPDHLK